MADGNDLWGGLFGAPLLGGGAGYLGPQDFNAVQNQLAQQNALNQYPGLAMQQMNLQQYGQLLNLYGANTLPFLIEGDGPFVAKWKCTTTGEDFEISSPEKAAVERGMRHFGERWNSAVSSLKSAGLKDDELHLGLNVLRPRIMAEALRERDLEEGVRQSEGRARELLLMCLKPGQLAEFRKAECFTVTSTHKLKGFPSGDFRIKKASSYNVEHIESGERFCVVAAEKVPIYDQLLTQKLLLEEEPERFFKTANRTGNASAGGLFGWAADQNEIMQRYITSAMRQQAETRERMALNALLGGPPADPAETVNSRFQSALQRLRGAI